MFPQKEICIVILACLIGATAGCRPGGSAPSNRGTRAVQSRQAVEQQRPAGMLCVGEPATPAGSVVQSVQPAAAALAPSPEQTAAAEREICIARVWLDLAQSKVGDTVDRRRELYRQIAQSLTQQKEIR